MEMDKVLKDRLLSLGQEHIVERFENLSDISKERLLSQLRDIDFNSLERCINILKMRSSFDKGKVQYEPAPVISVSEWKKENFVIQGEKLLKEGKVCVIIVAGGQGSRLGFDGPKGCFKIGPLSGKTLFEIHALKIFALSRKYDVSIPLYIMTSPGNHTDTVQFWERNGYFGLKKNDVIFFQQAVWPALFPDGKIVMDLPDHIFMSPDGHGGLLSALARNKIFDHMDRAGVEFVFYMQVDNPLVNICDPAFLGAHFFYEAEISLKVCKKRDPEEGLGVVVKKGGKYAIIEYSELTEEEKKERLPDGNLKFGFGSVAIHIFNKNFLRKESLKDLPLHLAFKKVPYCDEKGNIIKPEKPNAYKFEKFIFDVLPDASKVLNLEFDREDEFAPVKNMDGKDSPVTVQQAICEKSARMLEKLGINVSRSRDGCLKYKIEILPTFALTVEDLARRIDNKNFQIKGDILLE